MNWTMIALLFVGLGCRTSRTPTPTTPDTDTDTDTDADADADADTDLPTPTPCPEDPIAPNQTLADAATAADHTDLWVEIGRPDFFWIDLPARASVQVTAAHTWADGDVDLYLLDADGVVFAADGAVGATTSDVEQAQWCNATDQAARTHVYVELWQASLQTCNHYDLQLAVTPGACAPDEDTGAALDPR